MGVHPSPLRAVPAFCCCDQRCSGHPHVNVFVHPQYVQEGSGPASGGPTWATSVPLAVFGAAEELPS